MRFEELNEDHRAAFLDFVADMHRGDPDAFAAWFGAAPRDDLAFKRFAREASAERLDWRPKARQTSRTRYLLFDDAGAAVGLGVLQFPLGPAAEDNFQFVVAPSHRGRGFGALTLNKLLFEGARAGLARARVSCAADDPAAVRCITLNRGELIEKKNGRAAFWIKLR